jgi:hypothetical protein
MYQLRSRLSTFDILYILCPELHKQRKAMAKGFGFALKYQKLMNLVKAAMQKRRLLESPYYSSYVCVRSEPFEQPNSSSKANVHNLF